MYSLSLCSSLSKHRSDREPADPNGKSAAIYTRTRLGGIHLPRDISKEVALSGDAV